jgi:hypothetical protein
MRTLRCLGLLAGALGLLSCYAPDFENGLLQCGPTNHCPKGYTCTTDLTCWKDSDVGPPTGGDEVTPFIGTWTFDSGTLTANCSDGAPSTVALAGDTVPITRSGTGIVAAYFCAWMLHAPAGSTTAVVDPGQTCMEMIPDEKTGVTYTYSWGAKEFSFTTSDGQKASVKGNVGGPFNASDGSKGTCEGLFTGSLTKTAP